MKTIALIFVCEVLAIAFLAWPQGRLITGSILLGIAAYLLPI